VRLLTDARQLELPSRERATAEFHLEAHEGLWLGDDSERGFARISRSRRPDSVTADRDHLTTLQWVGWA
jgi:hypothetical protein